MYLTYYEVLTEVIIVLSFGGEPWGDNRAEDVECI
jgi:hypothetical protein